MMRQNRIIYLVWAAGVAIAWPGAARADLLAGWDNWTDADANSGASPYAPDSTATGFSATMVHSGTSNPSGRIHGSFGSTDGTFGTLAGASGASTPALLVRGTNNELALTITLTNNTGQAYTIDAFHFDFAPRRQDATNYGPNSFILTYDTGGLGPASTQIDSQSSLPFIITGLSNPQTDFPDYDYSLAASLSDITLDDGESATFTLAFSGHNDSNISSVVDNVAVTGCVVPEPATLTLAALGGLMLLKRRHQA